MYLIGRHFTSFNDHKALISILNRPRAAIPLRIERLTLRLQGFNSDLTRVKGENYISDYPSRHPHDKHSERSSKQAEYFVNLISRYACPELVQNDSWISTFDDLTLDEIQEPKQSKKIKLKQKDILF